MKILVAGGCGFLGSHVCELFKNKGWDVIAYDNMTKFETDRITFGDPERIRYYNLDYLQQLGVDVVRENVRDFQMVRDCAEGCDYIINCAAQPTMTLSSERPGLDFETNVIGALSILEAARKHHIPAAFCSSIHVYGTGINDEVTEGPDRYYRRPSAIDESHPVLTGVLTPLHASKRAMEIYVQTYAQTYGLDLAAFRLTGIYGPRQFGSEDHGWVSLLAIKAMLELPIQIIGTGKQVRDILYVKDAARAFEYWFEKGRPSGIYNIGGGPDTLVSVLGCLDKLCDLSQTRRNYTFGGERRGDLLYFVCDSERAWVDFEWRPTASVNYGLKELVNWLQSIRDMFHA